MKKDRKEATSAEDTTQPETKKAVTLEPINLNIFPDFVGAREPSSYNLMNSKDKFTIQLPVPANDEEAKSIYNRTVEEILRKGLKQLAYGVNKVIETTREEVKNGQDPNDVEYCRTKTGLIEGELHFTPAANSERAAARKLKDTKAGYLDQLMKDQGVESVEELKARIAAMQA